MAFLFAGLGLSLANSERLQTFLGLLRSTPLSFETSHDAPTFGNRNAIIRRADAQVPLILSGFPAYGSARFHLPMDARALSGELQIDLTAQALPGVEGMLRITIGNMRRAEVLIRPGDLESSVRVELTEHDIAQERLVVSFSLQGTGPHTPCGINEGFEVIVEIETTSAISLALDRPIETDIDGLLANGRVAHIALGDTGQADALLAGATLLRNGVDTRFAGRGLDAPEALALAAQFDRPEDVQQYAWSETLAPDSAAFGVRRFTRAQTWRIRYDMAAARDQRLPGQFNLAMTLGHLPDRAVWQVIVTLNGHLVHEGLAEAGIYDQAITLMADLHGRENTLEVELRSGYVSPGECARPPEVVAELLPRSQLLPGSEEFNGPMIGLLSVLSQGWSLDASGLTPPEATLVSGILAELPPPSSPGHVTVSALTRGHNLEEFRGMPQRTLLVFRNAAGALEVRDAADVRTRRAGQAMLLVQTGIGS